MKLKIFLLVIIVLAVLAAAPSLKSPQQSSQPKQEDPFTISSMRSRNYPGSDLKIEETLDPGSNYNQYII